MRRLDTFRLLLTFAEQTTGKSPTSLQLMDLNANLVLAFLDHIEQVRNNGVRSRNARLAVVRSFLKYAAHHDVSALHVIQQTMAVPTKRFDRPMLGFLTRDEMQAILEAPDAESLGRATRSRSFCDALQYRSARLRGDQHPRQGRDPG